MPDKFALAESAYALAAYRGRWLDQSHTAKIGDDITAVDALNDAIKPEAGNAPVILVPDGWEIAASLTAETRTGSCDGYEIRIRPPGVRGFTLCCDPESMADINPLSALDLVQIAIVTANAMLIAWRTRTGTR